MPRTTQAMPIDIDASTANMPDADGRRPLHHAALIGDTDLLNRILACGATVAAVDDSGWSALHSAASAGHVAACAVLLNASAPPDARTEAGTTALHHAAGKGHIGVVQALLQAGADPAMRTKAGDTALHRAAGTNRVAVMHELLAQLPRAAVDLQDKQGNTAMHVAAMEQHEGACVALAEAGASIKVKNIDEEKVADMLPERLLQRLGS